jgi:hypothetical protein
MATNLTALLTMDWFPGNPSAFLAAIPYPKTAPQADEYLIKKHTVQV